MLDEMVIIIHLIFGLIKNIYYYIKGVILQNLLIVKMKLEKSPRGLNSLKSKVDKLDVDKLKPVSVDLKNIK